MKKLIINVVIGFFIFVVGVGYGMWAMSQKVLEKIEYIEYERDHVVKENGYLHKFPCHGGESAHLFTDSDGCYINNLK